MLLNIIYMFNNISTNINNNESYTIVLNSNFSSGTINDAIFNFDWSILDNRSYSVHYTYNTSNMNISTGKVCVISSNLFTGSNTFFCQSLRTEAQTSNFLGVAYPFAYGMTTSLHADNLTSPAVYINTRPKNNQFTISIKTGDLNPVDYPNLSEWILVLHFKPIQ